MLAVSSCKDDNIDAGASGNVEYGEGDCMPPIDYSSRVYYDYNGTIFFIEESYTDSSLSYNYLKTISDSTIVENGEYVIDIQPGIYYVMPKEFYSARPENKITVYLDKLTEQDFKFWHCTSY